MRFQQFRTRFMALLVLGVYLVMICHPVYGAELTVKLTLGLENPEIAAGSEPIPLTAVTRGTNVRITWQLLGPGHIEGTGLGVLYVVPEQIEGELARAIITVTAKDKTGREATDSMTFTILSNPEREPAVSEPVPEPPKSKAGMRTGTKVALGAGAAALLGGGIAIAIQSGNGGGNGDAIPSLSGTWVGTVSGTDDEGNPLPATLKLVLTQKGDEITGYGQIETIPIDYVTGTYSYPNVSLTLDSLEFLPTYLEGTVIDKDTITGTSNGSGFNNFPFTLKRQ
jgi:hypothetical protein